MTTPHPFAALLRKLDAEASKAPWRDSSNAPSLFDGAGDSVIHYGDEVGAYVHDDDAALIVTLRNAAPEVAALVEAAGAAVNAAEYVIALCHDDAKRGRDPSPFVASTPSATLAHAYAAMAFVGELRAALDALAAKAKEDK